jgi:hypothetical protein
MSMHMHFKTKMPSFVNSFLLLVMVAGVPNTGLFESDTVSGYNDHKVLYRIELVFNTERTSQFPVLSISEDVPGNDVSEGQPSRFYATCFGTALFAIQNTGPVNTRPFYSPHNHTSLFNIPHQNSDEEEPFISPVDVA